MKIASFFSGAGGLDLGFTKAGFELAFANDNWEGCWETFEKNHNHPICKKFEFPKPTNSYVFLRDAIGDLPSAKSAKEKNKTNGKTEIPNHEYMNGGFSTIYMSRNRVRSWDEHLFTIQAGGKHAPIHPQAPKMKFI